MTDDALFPPTPDERIAIVVAFVSQERRHREHMAWKHPERGDYWHDRVSQCDVVSRHLAALREVTP